MPPRLAHDLYRLDAAAEPLPERARPEFPASRLADAAGARFVLKIANAREDRQDPGFAESALHVPERLRYRLEWPRVMRAASGAEIAVHEGHMVRLLPWVEGTCFALIEPHSAELLASLGRSLAMVDDALEGFFHPAADRTFYWDLRGASSARAHLELLSEPRRALVAPFLDACVAVDFGGLRQSVIYNDANDYNVLVAADGSRVVALLDLGDMVHSATVCDLAIALAYVMLDKPDPIAAAAQVVAAYHAVRPLTGEEIAALYPLAGGRLAMSVCYAAWQLRQAPGNEYLNISNRPAWALLERLARLPEGWPEEVFRRACDGPPRDLLAARRAHLGPSLSISYDQPLHIIRGWRQHLYDAGGRAYLDCVNNVAHVGHCHPRVTRAAAEQMALLNTNTRYLHEYLTEYVERLTATLPEPLRVVYLVCSGSEANELALRLARAHTGRNDVIVVDTAYHGNTNALVEISPYKFNGPGGRGKPPHVQVVPMPDVYRGRTAAPMRARVTRESVAEAARGRWRGGVLLRIGAGMRRAGRSAAGISARGFRRGARGGRRLHRRRSADRLRPRRLAFLDVRDARRGARHRDHGQADRQRPSHGRGGDHARDRARRSPTAWSTSTPSAAIRSPAPSAWRCST